MKKQLHKFCLTLLLAIGLTSTSFATKDTVAIQPNYVTDMQGNTLTSLTTNVSDTLVIGNGCPISVTFVVNTTTFTSIPSGVTFTYVVKSTDVPNFHINWNVPVYGNQSFLVNVNSITTGIADNTNKVQFNAFPNPVKDLLTLKSPNALGTIKVYSIAGKLVFTEIVKESETIIDVSAFSPGMYFVRVGDSIKKIIKE